MLVFLTGCGENISMMSKESRMELIFFFLLNMKNNNFGCIHLFSHFLPKQDLADKDYSKPDGF